MATRMVYECDGCGASPIEPVNVAGVAGGHSIDDAFDRDGVDLCRECCVAQVRELFERLKEPDRRAWLATVRAGRK